MEGWHGWDAYAPFYDWENARTMGRRDVPFWSRLAARCRGSVLELGCGTGRVSIPVARAGARLVGVDRSESMLRRARQRLHRARLAGRVRLVRGDIRELPFGDGAGFDLVMAPYGILQSMVRERDLRAALDSVARVTAPDGLFGIDLVPDLPAWSEYRRRARLLGRRGGETRVTLIESVRQDRRRRLTIFDQEFIERRGRQRTVRAFSLVFRTVSVPQMVGRLQRAGFDLEAVLGDYDGRSWDLRAAVWLILGRRRVS